FSFHKGMSFRLLARWGVKSAKRIIADSEFTKKDIIERYKVDEKKIEVIYLAPDESFKKIADQSLLEKTRLKYGIRKDYLIHVGAIHARRNIKRLLEAFQKIKGKNFNLQLVLVGGLNVKASDFHSLIHVLNLQSEVLHLTYVTEEDLVCLYNDAKALIYPSLYEGFGLPLVEAMACGTPVVAANATCIPEIVGEAALLFDPYSIEDIATKIMKILNNQQLREELSIKGIQRAQCYSWKKAAQRTINVYNQALGG
ncbi:MAG: glycosyltransferase family 1 protein, partial [bacterium]